MNDHPQDTPTTRTITLGTLLALFGVLCIIAILTFGAGG